MSRFDYVADRDACRTAHDYNHSTDSRFSTLSKGRQTLSEQSESKGFTIVELIVVISIIGILAAIGIVSYGSWKQSTTTSQLKSDLNGAVAALENSRTFNNTYPTTIPSTFVPSSGVTISGGGLNSGHDYCVSSTNGTLSYNIGNKYSAPIPGPCPVLYLDAGILTSYPGTGNTWYDLSGLGKNGTLSGGTSYSSANGGVLSFDGTDDAVDFPASAAPRLGDFSLEGWARTPSGVASNYGSVIGYGSWNYLAHYGIWNASASNTFRVGGNRSAFTDQYGIYVDITFDQWVYLVGTWDRDGNLVAYKNGAIYGSPISISSYSNVDYSTAPASGYYPGWYSQIEISSVRIYSRVLSASEITQNYNAQKSRFGL